MAVGLGLGGSGALGVPAVSQEADADLVIIPRSAWGGDLPAGNGMTAEAPGDVRFLLVHHTASTNDYSADATIGQLRGFYDFHTGEKGWPDVAYNFFVDRHGQVFEGRTGSLQAPIKPDATGGSQGFAQLGCFVGDHTTEPPTLAAYTSMIRLLAWLADTYRIDTAPGATTTFVSRGSNLHPAGTTVTTATIAGHRDMSQTTCPGDGVYSRVRDQFPAAVTQRRAEVAAGVTTTTVAPTTVATAPTSASSIPPSTTSAAVADPGEEAEGESSRLPLIGGIGFAAAALGGAVAVRTRRRRPTRP